MFNFKVYKQSAKMKIALQNPIVFNALAHKEYDEMNKAMEDNKKAL